LRLRQRMRRTVHNSRLRKMQVERWFSLSLNTVTLLTAFSVQLPEYFL
jgi:hypothetical protein